MASKYEVTGQWSLHESGTKFYQIIQISTPSKVITIKHWGPYDPHRHRGTPTPIPKHGGQTKVEYSPFPGDFSVGEAIHREKLSRGYKNWNLHSPKSLGDDALFHYLEEKLSQGARLTAILANIPEYGKATKDAAVIKEDVVVNPPVNDPKWSSW